MLKLLLYLNICATVVVMLITGCCFFNSDFALTSQVTKYTMLVQL